jgi:hypothetical protein
LFFSYTAREITFSGTLSTLSIAKMPSKWSISC